MLLKAFNFYWILDEVSKKTYVVNNNKDILLRFKEKMCPSEHKFIATFFFVLTIGNYWKLALFLTQ